MPFAAGKTKLYSICSVCHHNLGPPEMLKLAPVPAVTTFHELFRKVWTSGQVPSEWKEDIITSLYKEKEGKTDCSS